MAAERIGAVKRQTRETDIELSLDLNGTGEYEIATGVPFFDHMLSHVAKHGLISLNIRARGDIEVDYHHLVEDVGICLGEALAQAVGDKVGMVRYGEGVVPMDDACVLCALDFSGRPHLRYAIEIGPHKIGEFDTELGQVFFKAVAGSGKLTVHLQQLSGENSHHILEATFKAFGRALDQATRLDPRRVGVPSTKGTL
jgi:imidazoleglycerol-phosphate dehydratase